MRVLSPMHDNPWMLVPAADYEGHMGTGGVNQLGPLADMFATIYGRTHPRSLLILGCATGNGLQHVDPSITTRVVGVDIQPEYLAIAEARHPHLNKALQLICSSAEECDFQPGSFDLVHGGLFFEYVAPPPILAKIANWLLPRGICSAIVQLPSSVEAPVSRSRFASIARIKDVMRLVDPQEMVDIARAAGLRLVHQWDVSLPSGKAFRGLMFDKASEVPR